MQLSEQELAEAEAMYREQLLAELGLILGLFAPSFPVDKLPTLVDVLVKEQALVREQIMPAILEGEGELLINVKDRGGRAGTFRANRTVAQAKGDCGQALSSALVLAFLMFPAARGLLRVYGVEYGFVAPKPPPEKQLILV